jgi:hypothetical protein
MNVKGACVSIDSTWQDAWFRITFNREMATTTRLIPPQPGLSAGSLFSPIALVRYIDLQQTSSLLITVSLLRTRLHRHLAPEDQTYTNQDLAVLH